MTPRENRLTEAAPESATTTPSVPDEVDLTREMLARLEDLLDRIIATLAPLAGAL